MTDYGATATDELIAKMEKRMNVVYYQAEKEIKQKLKAFLKDYDEENKKKRKLLDSGKLSVDDYNAWVKSKASQKKWLSEMVNTLSVDHTLTNAKAMGIVRGFMPEAYAINRNYGAFQVEKGSLYDTSFTLYDAHTVQALVRDRPRLLPEPSPDIPKEMRWHKQQITHAITQGILQGESIPEIADRLQNVTDMDRRAAVRNARTATTAAQNKGRVDSYKDALKLGIEVEQEWLATLDGRTRHSHRLMDGKHVKVGEEFPNGCEYPGDPDGEPEEIYNCRCTLVPFIEGVSDTDAPRNSKLGDMDYEEWKYGHDDVLKYQDKIYDTQVALGKIEDKTYSGIWKNDVKLSDYSSKKDAIDKKRDYYEDQISTLQEVLKNDPDNAFFQSKLDEMEKHLKDLNEFEKQGQKYAELKAQLADYQKSLKEVQGITSPFTPDAYSAEREAAAFRFTSREEADKFLRPELDKQWANFEDAEKYGVWKYTENSNPMNKPLSGYEDSWDRSHFKGVGNANWSGEDQYGNRRNSEAFRRFGHPDGQIDHAKAIANLTLGIDKCELSHDMWFVRGSDIGGLAGLMEGGLVSFEDAEKMLRRGDIDTLKQLFEGQSFQSHSFLSTGIAEGTGFGGQIAYRIYAPQGTHCVYAEPQSYYGDTHGFRTDTLYSPGDRYSGVGREAEMIFQRGTWYRMRSIEYDGYQYTVTLEVVDQPDYFVTGYEQTADNGATSFIP